MLEMLSSLMILPDYILTCPYPGEVSVKRIDTGTASLESVNLIYCSILLFWGCKDCSCGASGHHGGVLATSA